MPSEKNLNYQLSILNYLVLLQHEASHDIRCRVGHKAETTDRHDAEGIGEGGW
jgi:hypothetical protein